MYNRPPGHRSWAITPAQGLGAEMALEVEHVTAREFAEVVPLEGGEPAVRVRVPVEAVEPAGEVDGGAGVPVGLVGAHQPCVLVGAHGSIQS